jgi:outer membrane protein
MRKSFAVAASCLAALVVSAPAHAGSPDGKFQVKAFATGVLPDGKITSVTTDRLGLPANAQTKASDSVVPTIAAEYFFSPNLSVETICCVTPHDVTGEGGLAGAALIDNAIILPATVTAKYHFTTGSAIKPYVGAGPAYFFIFSEDVGSSARGLGITSVSLSNDLGFALQAGVDVNLNDKGLGLSLDAKRYFVDTTARFNNPAGVALETRHRLDPWVVSAGIGYRF